jgi:hypothetical protein
MANWPHVTLGSSQKNPFKTFLFFSRNALTKRGMICANWRNTRYFAGERWERALAWNARCRSGC